MSTRVAKLAILSDAQLAMQEIYRRGDGSYVRAVYAFDRNAARVAIHHYEEIS